MALPAIAQAGLIAGGQMTGDLIGNALSGISATNINNANINATREVNRANEGFMRESWAREDSAIQRRVADMIKAGLNPVLAAGAGAQAGVVAKMEAPRVSENPMESFRNFGSSASRGFGSAFDALLGQQDVKIKMAQERLLNAQADSARVDADFKARDFDNKYTGSVATVEGKQLDNALKSGTLQYQIQSSFEDMVKKGLENDYLPTSQALDEALRRVQPANVSASTAKIQQEEISLKIRNALDKVDAPFELKSRFADLMGKFFQLKKLGIDTSDMNLRNSAVSKAMKDAGDLLNFNIFVKKGGD